jgi:hypothetical protein
MGGEVGGACQLHWIEPYHVEVQFLPTMGAYTWFSLYAGFALNVCVFSFLLL